ncbi:unnamed protein product, partial [Hapterophycus canaliculatus]
PPEACTVRGVTTFQHRIEFVYPDISTADSSSFADRGVFAPANTSLTVSIATSSTSSRIHYTLLKSADRLTKSYPNDIAEITSAEFLNTVNVPGAPPHSLDLTGGCVVMFIRNVNFDSGIVNGRRRVVRSISSKIIDVQISANGCPLVKIPRITFEAQVGRNGVSFHRQQFPLRVCYAMTIEKNRRQTSSGVGLDLLRDVSSHGRLYVALSRISSSRNVMTLVKADRHINGVPHVANCVCEPFIL